jgi:hypothetical protein
MPRYAPKMSIEDLKTRLANLAVENDYVEEYNDDLEDFESVLGMLITEDLMPNVLKDWSKVDFDLENIMLESFKTTASGVPFALLLCGGDWETPIATVVYYDGKTFRGYVPKNGNPYNHQTKTAFGNEDEDVDQAAYEKQTGSDNEYNYAVPVWSDIYADIDSRIEAKGVASAESKPVKSKAKIRAEEQRRIEKDLDLTGDLTPDMLQVEVSLAAGGSYFEVQLRASGRKLTKEECNRVQGIPATMRKEDFGDRIIWYSPMGVYPQRCWAMLEAAGFAKNPDNDLSYHVGGTRTVYI